MTRCHCASGNSAAGARWVIPALFTRISTGPRPASTASVMRATLAASLTSTVTASARPPPAAIASATACAPAALASATATAAPASASPRAMAAPSPPAPPTTTATWPSRRKRSRLVIRASIALRLGLETGHGEGAAIELGDQRGGRVAAEVHQRGAHGGPGGIAAVVGDGRLQRGDHGELLEDAADLVQPRLLRVGVAARPRGEQPRDGGGVHIGGGADAALAAAPHVGEEEGLAAREDVEAGGGERIQHRLGIAPVAGGVLHARDRPRIGLEQPLDERKRDRHLGHRRDVIDV